MLAPMAPAMLKAAGIPRRFMPAAIMLGTATFIQLAIFPAAEATACGEPSPNLVALSALGMRSSSAVRRRTTRSRC